MPAAGAHRLTAVVPRQEFGLRHPSRKALSATETTYGLVPIFFLNRHNDRGNRAADHQDDAGITENPSNSSGVELTKM